MAIDLNLELAELEADSFLFSILDMGNIQGGIKRVGFGLDTDVPIQAGINGGTNAPIQAQIIAPFIDPPTTPLAAHLGQGTLYFVWDHPHPEKVDRYELFVSINHSGPYFKLERGVFSVTHGAIQNMPLGLTLHFKIQAIGKNAATSTQVQVKKGKFYTPLVTMKVHGIQGSSIPANAIFNAVDQQTGMILAVRSKSPINIQ